MNIIVVSCVAIAVVLINQVNAACICPEGGSSLCTCNPSYVKPKPKPVVTPESKTICRTIGAKELRPIGDVCSCGEVHVIPSHEKCSGKADCSCTKCSKKSYIPCENEHEIQRDFAGTKYDFASDIHEQKSPRVNPDLVSMILAYDEFKKCTKHVPESKLHYGHIGKVKDGYVSKQRQDLKDGAIYEVIGEPLSLRRCKHRQDEEIEEVEEEEVFEETPPVLFTYEDLGYKPHKYKQRTYVKHYGPERSYQCKDKSHSQQVTHSTKLCSCKTSTIVKDSDQSPLAFELLA